MLSRVKRPDSAIITFKYDALGRRIEKCFNNRVFTKWVWDGNTPLHEWKEIHTPDYSEEKGEFTNIQKPEIVTWVFEEGTFVPTAKLTEQKKLSIVTNYMGTPEAMYDDSGEKAWSCELNSYGKVRSFRGDSKGDCPFRYQGQYEDSETGLYYNRFRYYSSEEGMYLSQDPIRLNGGFALYSYVPDPNGWVDIFGLINWKGFSKGELNTHYDKHVVQQQEFGNISKSEYLSKAKDFGNSSGETIREANVGNFLVKHDSETGEVFVGNTKDREIRTYYIDDGRDDDAFEAAKELAAEKSNNGCNS